MENDFFSKYKRQIIPLAAVLLVIGAYYAFVMRAPSADTNDWQVFADGQNSQAAAEQEQQPQQPQTIMFYITGEVNNPAVYELPHDSRVIDAIDAAGGATEYAAIDTINLSLRISDEDHIIIPKIGDETSMVSNFIISGSRSSETGSSGTAPGLININTATSAELQTLSGVGPVTAQRLIDFREANGRFNAITDIMKVSGIGERTFESLKPHITVD